MPKIEVVTVINNKKEIVFDLARSIDVHLYSTTKTNERVIEGRKVGLMQINEQITWRARHLGFYQNLTVEITELEYPDYFVDEMIKGTFKSFTHSHIFIETNGKTTMNDVFSFESPFGIIGEVFNYILLNRYMKKFLISRNQVMK